MDKRMIDIDPVTGIRTFHHYDHDTKITRIEQQQDCQRIVDHCKTLANDGSYKARGIKQDWYHFARVPNTVLVELMQKYNLDYNRREDLPKIEQVLQRDYKKLLTVNRI